MSFEFKSLGCLEVYRGDRRDEEERTKIQECDADGVSQ
jgi:hypothetical protein